MLSYFSFSKFLSRSNLPSSLFLSIPPELGHVMIQQSSVLFLIEKNALFVLTQFMYLCFE